MAEPEKKRSKLDAVKNGLASFLHFITLGIWRIRLDDHPPHTSVLIKSLRVVILSLKEFQRDKCQLRASALTYYTLLSIVPLMAMAFGIAKGFGFQQRLENIIFEKIAGGSADMALVPTEQQNEMLRVAEKLVEFSKNALEQTSGGFIAGIGIAVLIWAVIKLLGNIELSFNAIWGLKKSRHIGRKFTDYLSFMLLAPILFIMSSSMTVVIKSKVSAIFGQIELLGALAPLVESLLNLTPFVLIWILFSFIYIFMPNTRVRLSSGIIAGIVAGTIFQITLRLYLYFQIGVSKYNTIYGSFAALPLFLILLQISWVIVLYGAEISFAYQNVGTYEFEPDCDTVSSAFKRLVALRIVELISKRFAAGDLPYTYTELSQALEIPSRLLRQLLFDLQNAGLVSEVLPSNGGQPGYLPALDVGKLTIAYVTNALDRYGSNDIPIAHTQEIVELTRHIDTFREAIRLSPANVPLKDI
jgi:membrane protein